MTRKDIKGLSDGQLRDVLKWVNDELRLREKRAERDKIAEVKRLAAKYGLSVTCTMSKDGNKKTF